jgi:MFS family permease
MVRRPAGPRRNLWPLVAGQSVSQLGDYLAFYFALPVFVRDATGSAAQLGVLAAFETVAVILFGFLAGVLLDRVRIRRAIISADLVRAAGFGLLATAVALDVATVWMAFGVAFLVGSMGTVFDSGLESLMPSMLTDDLLVVANSRLSVGRNLAQTLGFVVGGVVVAWSGGVAGAFAFDALTYLCSVAALLVLVEVRPRPPVVAAPVFAALGSGLRTLWRSTPLRWATAAATLTNLAFAPLAAVMTLYAREDLGISDDARLGVFFAGFSAIGAAGVMTAPRLVRRIGLGRSVVVGGFMFGAGALATGLVDGWWAVLTLGLALSGVSVNQVGFATLRQRLTPPDHLGRVVSASRTIAWAGIPVGASLGGLVGDHIGLRPLFAGGGIAICGVAALMILGPLWRIAPAGAAAD